MTRMRWILAIFCLVPASRAEGQIMVVGNSVQEQDIAPGERHGGRIRLRNQGTADVPVRIYQRDYVFQADGTNLYPSPGSLPRSNATWMAVSPSDLVVPAGEEVDVSYQVTVPADPTLAGTYWSMIMVEPTEADRDAAAARGSVGLRAIVRFGVQVATHIGDAPPHRLRLANPNLTAAGEGERHLAFELVNEGDAGFRPKVSVDVFDQQGNVAASVEDQRGLLYPGTSALQHVPLGDLSPGVYEAVVVVDTGALEVFGGQFKVTLGSSD